MTVGEEFPEIIITPEEIAALRAASPWWEWKLHTDEEMRRELIKERQGKNRKEEEGKMKGAVVPTPDLEINNEAERVRVERLKELEELFSYQIQDLSTMGCPGSIREYLVAQKRAVLDKASSMLFGPDRIPFLPVIPAGWWSLAEQIKGVRSYVIRSRSLINTAFIKDAAQRPAGPYYIFDVDWGSTTFGRSSNDTTEKLLEESRLILTTAEAISLCVWKSEVLTRCKLYTHSYFSSLGRVVLARHQFGMAVLGWCSWDLEAGHYGCFPSCADYSYYF